MAETRKYCCYPDECWAHGSETDQPDAIWAGPCWGESVVIDEDYTEDDHWWIHGCQGHLERWGKYVPQPAVPSPCEEVKR